MQKENAAINDRFTPRTYPIGDKSLKFGKLKSEISFIAIEDVVLFVCVLNTDKRPKTQSCVKIGQSLIKMNMNICKVFR